MDKSNSVNSFVDPSLSYKSFKRREERSSSSSSSNRTSPSSSPTQAGEKCEDQGTKVKFVISPSPLKGIYQQTSIRIPSSSPHITEASHQTYEVWEKLEHHFGNGELAPFWVKSFNEKENPSSKVFTLSLHEDDSDEEGEIDNSLVELEDYNPQPLSEDEKKVGFRIVDPAQESAKKYFIVELEKIFGREAIGAVYPIEERSEPLTAEKAKTVFNSLELLRNRAEKACEGDFSKFDTYLSLEIDRFQSDRNAGKEWQKKLDQRFSPQKQPTVSK